MSKEERTKIHDAVKKAFGDSIVSSTVNTGDKKLLRFEKFRKGGLYNLIFFYLAISQRLTTIAPEGK